MSSLKKKRRLYNEARNFFSNIIQADNNAIQEYAETFLIQFLNHLCQEGVEAACNLMFTYNVTPEFLRENLLELCPRLSEEFNKLPSILKTSFTKTYNAKYGESVKAGKKGKKK